MDWKSVARCISRERGRAVSLDQPKFINGGGCINSAAVVSGSDGRRYFVKFNDPSCGSMFEAELTGLVELKSAEAVRVPEPVCCGVSDNAAFLVLEYLELGARKSGTEKRLGQQLATVHRKTASLYGWDRHNTIGATPQINSKTDDWIEFWRIHRLGYQLSLARQNGHGCDLQRTGERLLSGLNVFFSGYDPQPSLLHGDLWGGNFAALSDGAPVLYDPAVYYGDRETDIAMTELFGGFGSSFYASYRDNYPLDAGYQTRKHLYNLYHVLNHLNLFGGGYLRQVETLLDLLVAEL